MFPMDVFRLVFGLKRRQEEDRRRAAEAARHTDRAKRSVSSGRYEPARGAVESYDYYGNPLNFHTAWGSGGVHTEPTPCAPSDSGSDGGWAGGSCDSGGSYDSGGGDSGGGGGDF